MIRLTAVRQRTAALRAGADAGMTLLEVVVSMTIMSILMSIFTAAAIQMYRAANQAESVSAAQWQTYVVHQRLDSEIRYASAISTEGTHLGSPTVEYLTTNTGAETCSQLWLDTASQQLKRRSGPRGGTPGPWVRLASGVIAPDSGKPFTFAEQNNYQTLNVHLLARSPGSSGRALGETDVTFTALNTPRGTDTSRVCTEWRQP